MVTRRWKTIFCSSEEDGPRFVPVADGTIMLPDRFVTTGNAGDDEPVVRLTFEVVAGVPQCRRLEITATEGGREVRPSDVISVHVDHVLELIYSRIGLKVHEGSGLEPSWSGSPNPEGALQAVRSARRGRPRTMTPALLSQVAAIYREHVLEGTPTAEVARRFSVSPRTARLYVQRARQAGLLGGSIPGRAGETTTEEGNENDGDA